MIKFHRILLPVLGLSTAPLLPASGHAQEPDAIPGSSYRRLIGVYDLSLRPGLAIMPFRSRLGAREMAPEVEAIIARDLRYSDRFVMMDSIVPRRPDVLIDYDLWNSLGATWLLSGSVEGGGGSNVLVLELHDVPFGKLERSARFTLPASASADGFRMAVHRVSDEVVEWIFDEPGMAASRIVFPMRRDGSSTDLWIVDSDGENLRRLTNLPGDRSVALSPAWHPSGERIAYVSDEIRPWDIFEYDFTDGRARRIDIERPGQPLTPAYTPDGSTLAFAITDGSNSGIYTYDVDRRCCIENLMIGRRKDYSPSYSPDGQSIVFSSNRIGAAVPQVYQMNASGGSPSLVSPYALAPTSQFNGPEWSSRDGQIAFHGKVGRVGRAQILVTDLAVGMGELTQLTREGNNEDPSWAPDGRHLVFATEQRWGHGLMIKDLISGEERILLSGVRATTPAWSPGLN